MSLQCDGKNAKHFFLASLESKDSKGCDGKSQRDFPSILGKAFGFSRGRQKIRSRKKIRGEKMEKEKTKPEHVRVGGIEVTIWENNGFRTVTMQRTYKDKNNEWQKTNSLGQNDIPKAVLALEKAYETIVLKE